MAKRHKQMQIADVVVLLSKQGKESQQLLDVLARAIVYLSGAFRLDLSGSIQREVT